ncbi:MAG: hypothetical protein Q8P32_02285 [Candidatus Komeilibacteria bacterium]|nr:hypothetical protein [Candidatus Komeilibacteria bacterium]
MKKSFVAVAVLTLSFLGLFFISPVKAQEAGTEPNFKAKLYFFYGDGCPHCAKEEEFIKKLLAEEPNFAVAAYEVWKSSENRQLMVKVGEALGVSPAGVPFNVVGKQNFTGYLNDETNGEQIRQMLSSCLAEKCEDVVGGIIAQTGLGKEDQKIFKSVQQGQPKNNSPSANGQDLPDTLTVPIFGTLDLKTISLPAFTVIIGLLDGFNPCAMWVLLFLISLLLGMKNRKRMWILGVTFILASAAVYFLVLAAWLNVLLLFGFIIWLRYGIGLVALYSGFYHLKSFFKNKTGECEVTDGQKKRRFFDKLKEITQTSHWLLALGGIIILAVSVNLVELLCSAGLPAVYTQVLTMNNLSMPAYYGYILLYLFFFMLDDLAVFIIAMVTLKGVGMSGKYNRWSSLIGGILMLLIGLLLLFKPGWLMFG